jgi:hypothetical protein
VLLSGILLCGIYFIIRSNMGLCVSVCIVHLYLVCIYVTLQRVE